MIRRTDVEYTWRRGVGRAPCAVYRAEDGRGRQGWKEWRRGCWDKYGTGVSPDVHNTISELKADGMAIWRDGKSLAYLEDHLCTCFDFYGKEDTVCAALLSFVDLTWPDRLLYVGGDHQKVNALLERFKTLKGSKWVQFEMKTRYAHKNKFSGTRKLRTMYVDPNGVPPLGVRGFVHFMLLVTERVAVLPPEIWRVILSFCTVDELCFKFVPRRREPCGHCGKPASWWCRRCKAVRYCDKRCQRAGYKVHKHVCCRPYFPQRFSISYHK